MKVILPIFLLFISYGYGNVLDDALPIGDVNECYESCGASYPPHTYPNGEENEACLRGCRLYCITVMTKDILKDLSGIIGVISEEKPAPSFKELCYQACVESYNETSANTVACKSGCDAQKLKTDENMEKQVSQKEEELPEVHFMKPLMQIRQFFSTIEGSIHIARTSVRSFFLRDDDTVVGIESEPEVVFIEMMPEEPIPVDQPEQLREAASNDIKSFEFPDMLEQPNQRKIIVEPDIIDYLLMFKVALVCLLLTMTVYFAFHRSSNKKKFLMNNMTKEGEIAGPLPVKLVRPEDLTKLTLMEEDDQQAPALPTKVKLPDSTV